MSADLQPALYYEPIADRFVRCTLGNWDADGSPELEAVGSSKAAGLHRLHSERAGWAVA